MSPSHTGPDLTRSTLAVFLVAALCFASFWILRPFLIAAVWATMTVVATWPVLLRLQARLGGRRGRAVTVLTVCFLLLLIVPLFFASLTVISNAGWVTEWLLSLQSTGLPQAPDWLGRLPLVGTELSGAWNQLAAAGSAKLFAFAGPHLGRLFQWFVGELGGVGMLIVQFLLTVVIAAVLYSTGDTAARGVLLFGHRLAGTQGEQIMILAAKAIRGIALGVVVTALVQAFLAGVGLVVAGIPAPGVLTVVIFVLCIAQLGPWLIMLPASGWLLWSGQTGWGSACLVWSIAVGTIDNFLRPILIKKGVDLPFLLILSGVMGGLFAFGLIGIFVGPVVLAVTYTLLQDWVLEGRPSPGP
jgi:predicted PurR-regulated permease PerM